MNAQLLLEKMTFDQLMRMSEPKRILRSKTVKGPPLKIESYQDKLYYIFNFKSNPSTTGLRHKGFIKFEKPSREKSLEHVNCLVDCTCPDFKYRWAWADKQRQASKVGANSLNQAINRAPRVTNPSARPGLCKHVLALRDYIYGQISGFTGSGPDVSKALDRLTRQSTRRWQNFPAEVATAKEKEARLKAARDARRRGLPVTGRAPGGLPQQISPGQELQVPDDEEGGHVPESVGNDMSVELQDSIKILREMEGEVGNTAAAPDPGKDQDRGAEALGLLTQIRDLLQSLVADEEEVEPEGGEMEEPDLEEVPAPAPQE